MRGRDESREQGLRAPRQDVAAFDIRGVLLLTPSPDSGRKFLVVISLATASPAEVLSEREFGAESSAGWS